MLHFGQTTFLALLFGFYSINSMQQVANQPANQPLERITVREEFCGFLLWWHGGAWAQALGNCPSARFSDPYRQKIVPFKQNFGANYAAYSISIKKGLIFNSIKIKAILNTVPHNDFVGAPTNQYAPIIGLNTARHLVDEYLTPSELMKSGALIAAEIIAFCINDCMK